MVSYGPSSINTLLGATTSTTVIAASVQGDANARYIVNADGTMGWGPGSAPTDTNLYRATNGQLNTDGKLAVGNNLSTAKNLLVGSGTFLGDNGVGELQVANAATPPTTNPTGGVALYAANGTALLMRDTSGAVRSLARTYVPATADQTSVSTTQTASTYLTAALAANATYLVDLVAYWTVINAATVTTSWTGPAGATMIWNDTSNPADVTTTLAGTGPAWATGTKSVRLFGQLVTAGTAGNLVFTWASSVAASATVKGPGSWLALERVA